MAREGGGGGHDRANEVRAAVFALTSLEIAIAGTGAAFVRRQDVGVHANAHAAPGIAPLEACGGENLVEPFFFRLRLYSSRAGPNPFLLGGFFHVLAFTQMRGTT